MYATEADLLNVALFGKTAAEWRKSNFGTEGNIRDNASIEQLIVLTNLESINSIFIEQGMNQKERLVLLNKTAINQLKSLFKNASLKRLK